MKTPDQIADEFVDTIRWPYTEQYTISATELADMLAAAIEADRAQRGIIALVADALDDRGATDAAQLVRETDPDDDLWNSYLGPMLDGIEKDYTDMAKEGAQ